MRLPLIPHPTSRHDGLTLEVEARRQGGRLSLDYALSGPVEAVLWPQQAARVRVETDHGGGHAQGAGLFDGLTDDGLMAEVDAIEGADGGRGAAQVGR